MYQYLLRFCVVLLPYLSPNQIITPNTTKSIITHTSVCMPYVSCNGWYINTNCRTPSGNPNIAANNIQIVSRKNLKTYLGLKAKAGKISRKIQCYCIYRLLKQSNSTNLLTWNLQIHKLEWWVKLQRPIFFHSTGTCQFVKTCTPVKQLVIQIKKITHQ